MIYSLASLRMTSLGRILDQSSRRLQFRILERTIKAFVSSARPAHVTLQDNSALEQDPADPLHRWRSTTQAAYVNFNSMEPTVRQELERATKENKVSLSSLPRFSRILNGLRPHELSIFTGPTGCGKTTVLSQMSLDYAMQGLRVLWGSFEIRNSRLAQIMLQQLASQPLVDESGKRLNAAAYEDGSQALRRIPLYFMNLFGSTSLDTVLGTMQMSMEGEGFQPQLIILDNLQFMLSGQASNALDKWELMDRAVACLRAFCNHYAVHVMLVVHPRKEMDDTPLGIASVSGTAKATQEADNVIILQKLGDKRFLDVKKNRFYGDLGRVQIGYITASRMVREIAESADASNIASPPTAESPSTDQEEVAIEEDLDADDSEK